MGVAVPNQPAKSREGDAPLSWAAMYQNVRKATMNVLGFALMMPRAVAAAQLKAMPKRRGSADDGWSVIARSTGTARNARARRSELANFHQTNCARSSGAAKTSAVVPARFSREATSAMAMAHA